MDWSALDEVIFGSANQSGEDNRNVARMAALLVDLPVSVPGTTVNRLCASGMDAVGVAARGVRALDYDIVIAGGVESMSRAPFVMPKPVQAFSRDNVVFGTTIGWRFVNSKLQAKYGTDSMPQTADNVAHELGISREDQDAFAFRSQQRWAKAQEQGLFADEIVPVSVPSTRGEARAVTVDEHPRIDSTIGKLAALRGVNGNDKSVTAGNSSGVYDGAAALLVANEASIARLGLRPLARVVAMASAGVEPRLMGIGPVPATRKVLSRTKLELADMAVIELNEAFAAQALAVLRELGLPDDAEQVNRNGGAIAMGHPHGMSGARLALTAAWQLKRGGGRYALCTMCVGVGQGTALILEATS
jgi:3-oxoadipyl-CoA thiolase